MTMAKISARKCASNVIVSTTPDVCWTPVGSDVVKVGYTSIAFLDTAIRHSTTVRNNGKFDFQLNSRTATSTGHEPGTKKGVVVPGYLGPAHVKVASAFVYSEGWATASHRDPAWINRPDPGPVEPEKSGKVVMFDDCVREWEEARGICRGLLRAPTPSRSLTGGHTTIEGCAKGFVSAACGGNPV